jgi:hypothetical protein
MNVESPVYVSDTSSYIFFITNGPVYSYKVNGVPSSECLIDSIGSTDTDTFSIYINDFLTEFLQSIIEHFETTPSHENFLENLTNRWTDPFHRFSDYVSNPLSDLVSWVPIQVILGIEGYTIVWAFHITDPGSPGDTDDEVSLNETRAHSPFEEPSTPAEPQESSVITPADTVIPRDEVEEFAQFDLSAIPYSGEESISTETQNADAVLLRARERRLIRETRLRAEMIQLRAERLAQRYLNKYGGLSQNDTESVLSFSSDSS